MITRHPKWHLQLEEFLLDRKSVPFAWGSNDCALFAADAILSMTGTDLASEFRGKYSTQLGAMKLITQVVPGGSTLEDAAAHCTSVHGLTEYTHPLMAKRGDLVVVDNAGANIAGVIHLNGTQAVSVSEDGILLLPILDSAGKPALVRAWSV